MNKIIQGDAIEEMKKLPENSVDAIITDPPYGLEFMGKEWDKFKEGKNIAGGTTGIDTPFGRSKPLSSAYQYGLKEKNALQQFCYSWAKECLRVLKPGGFLLSFGGTRTYHRMTCGIEDAGFEIRDTIMWLYGSGFPKSLNIGKQIDKIQGNEREVVGGKIRGDVEKAKKSGVTYARADANKGNKDIFGYGKEILTKGQSEWEGWGTALKPACEPIVVARKPLSEKNVALNVLKWGTGGLNIDKSRINIDIENRKAGHRTKTFGQDKEAISGGEGSPDYIPSQQGRFPSNIILDEQAGKMLDEQSGESVSNVRISEDKDIKQATWSLGREGITPRGHSDKGGASRFFYCAKASKRERNFGLEEFEDKVADHHHTFGVTEEKLREREELKKTHPEYSSPKRVITKNNHPTVKPIKLMEYVIKLVSREGAIVLDPFIGSGTTAIACLKLNRRYIGIEKEEEYVKIANARIKPFLEQSKLN